MRKSFAFKIWGEKKRVECFRKKVRWLYNLLILVSIRLAARILYNCLCCLFGLFNFYSNNMVKSVLERGKKREREREDRESDRVREKTFR